MDHPDRYLAVARVVAARGIRGEVRCDIITDFPDRLKRTHRLYRGETHLPVEVERTRLEKSGALLKLSGCETRTDAEALRGQMLYVAEADAVARPGGSYFWHQIIGLKVRSDAGQDLGEVADIMQTGSNDVY